MNKRKIRMAALFMAVGLSSAAEAAVTWNGSSWTGTNYDNITVDDTYYAEGWSLANFNNITNYGTITVPVGVNLDFQGVNHGTITSSSTGFLIWSGENFGTLEGTQLSIMGSFQNHHTMSLGTLSTGGGNIFTNNGNLNVSSQYAGGDWFVNNGTADIGTLAGLRYFENTATGSITATTLSAAQMQNAGTGTVSGSITAGLLTNSGALSSDSLAITSFEVESGFTAQLSILTGGSITTTGAVDLQLIGNAGFADAKSIINGTLTAGQGVTVGSQPDNYEFTLEGTGVVNGDVFINKNGTLDPGLTINGTVSYWAPPPVPEPETYAMMLAGLGLVGFVSHRRSKNKPFAR